MESKPSKRQEAFWATWAVVAAFGAYFCMYGFRKPFTAAGYEGAEFWSIDFKTIVVSVQVLGYMLSKFIGIKFLSETPRSRRAIALLVLIAVAEIALLFFGLLPRPWNAGALFVNGLALGMVFGLVLGFLEGRRVTEALVAGLCASFVLADGVTKSVGAWLLQQNVPEDWMPFLAGLVFLLPLIVCVAMLARIPEPTAADIAERSERSVMVSGDRWRLFWKFAPGLTALVGMYLLITILRSLRADFAPELWEGLGVASAAGAKAGAATKGAAPAIYTQSESIVAAVVLVLSASMSLFRSNRLAFSVSIAAAAGGFLLIFGTLVSQPLGLGAFPTMVLLGLGLYLPYVLMHTTIFERILAITRERGNLTYLMYLADAFGYLGYVVVMFAKNIYSNYSSAEENIVPFFFACCWIAAVLSLACLALAWRYFSASAANASNAVAAKSHS